MLADTEVVTVNCFVWYYFCLVKFTMSELGEPSCLWLLLFLALLENKRSRVCCKKDYLGKDFPPLSILQIHTIKVTCFTKRKTQLGLTLGSKSYCNLWSRKTWFNNNNNDNNNFIQTSNNTNRKTKMRSFCCWDNFHKVAVTIFVEIYIYLHVYEHTWWLSSSHLSLLCYTS